MHIFTLQLFIQLSLSVSLSFYCLATKVDCVGPEFCPPSQTTLALIEDTSTRLCDKSPGENPRNTGRNRYASMQNNYIIYLSIHMLLLNANRDISALQIPERLQTESLHICVIFINAFPMQNLVYRGSKAFFCLERGRDRTQFYYVISCSMH